MQCNAVDVVKTEQPNEPYIASIEVIEPMEPKTREDVMDALTFLRAKFRDGADKLPSEEREKYRNVFQHIIKEMRDMEQSLEMAECNPDDRVLQMVGSFPCDASGHLCFPNKEDVQISFLRKKEECNLIEVESVSMEDNYNFLLSGPTCSNYLLCEPTMFVKFKTLDQSKQAEKIRYVDINFDFSRGGKYARGFQFITPKQNSTERAAYRGIGDLIKRLKEVDSKLKALGAIPGIGGLPELSGSFVQKEDYDIWIKSSYNAVAQCWRKDSLPALHKWLCSKTRVDRRRRQTALEPLVDERLDILLQLAQFDPDQYPVVIEREFK